MAAGINTSKRNLDDPTIDWANFDIFLADWPLLPFPEFGGRYFLGGRFEQPDPTNHEITCVANWSCGELFTSPVGANVNFIVPIQAGIRARLELTGKKGRLAGRIDAKRFCERIQAAITVGDFVMPEESKSIYVFLEVEDGTTLSKYYWQAWAAEIVSFMLVDSPGIVRPFLPCIMCGFEYDATSGRYVPSPADVQPCLEQLLIRDGKSYKQCHAFWARTVDEIVIPPNTPAIGSDIFGDFSQQFDTHRTVIPILFWQFATPDPTDPTVAGLNLSVMNDSINLEDCTLQHAGWDAINDAPTVFGIDTATPTIATPEITTVTPSIPATTNEISCLKTTPISHTDVVTGLPSPADGQAISFVGRYFKHNENLNGKKRLTAAEMKALTAGGLNIISIFQANFRNVGGVNYAPGWGSWGVDYFSHGFDFGILDGYDACTIADGTHAFYAGMDQPDRTVIYFATDYDPEWPDDAPTPAEVEQRMTHLEDYFKGVAAGLIQYHDYGGTRYYDIGIYAVKSVCERLYPLGIISHFWQLRYRHSPNNYVHANMIQTDLNDPVACGLEVDLNIAWGAEGSWNSKTEFTKP